MGSDQLRNSGKSSFSANNYYADYHYRDNPATAERYNAFIAETNRRASYQRKPLTSTNHFVPRAANANHFVPPSENANHMHTSISNRESYQQKQFCRHFARGRCHFGDNCKFLHGSRD